MSAPIATEAQILARVRQLIGEHSNEKVFGLRTEPRWTGAEVRQVGAHTVRVVECPSALAMRQALLEADGRSERLVLLTDRPESDLGDDVMARLARRRLFTLDPWDTLKGLFHARNIDPKLAGDAAIATALIEAVPSGGFPAAPGGFLTAELAWGTLIESRLGLPRAPTLGDLLTWTRDESAVLRWGGGSDELRAGLRCRLTDALGPAASAVLDLVEKGEAADSVPLGLALRVLYDAPGDGGAPEDGDSQMRVAARARLETLIPGGLPPAAALAWADESERLVRLELEAGDEARARATVQRAERILTDLRAADAAHLSDVLAAGFEQRLARLAEAALRCSDGEPDALDPAAIEAVERHALARLEPHRVRAARMAVRLARWLAGPGASAWAPESFAAAAVGHTRELSFVDWARRTLWGGDRSAAVDAAYKGLTAQADRVRSDSDRRFAALLAGWLAAGASSAEGLVLLENVLDEVIAPLAHEQPVLMLVADGMSVDVANELVDELVRRGWAELAPESAETPPTGVACLPTVTEACRTTLLSGELKKGDQRDERRRFSTHPALVSASRSGGAPVLFHRGDLTKQGAHRLPEPVAQAVGPSGPRVVGVVVNAVDDLLIKGGQLRPLWSPDAVPVLGALVEAARDAGRAVVLVSDHGHIVERGTTYREPQGGGERWRNATSPPGDDEVLLEHPKRVLLGEGKVIAAATEWTRYSSARRDGYHGGATPREAIVPLRVLRAPMGELPAGWKEVAVSVPCWWDGATPRVESVGSASARAVPRRTPPKGQQALFGEVSKTPSSSGTWIDDLLASEVYRAQAEHLGARGRPDDDRVRAVLGALDAHGGTSTQIALARAAGIPEVRINAVLVAMRRLLSIDGYNGLSLAAEGDSVSIDLPTLRAQFGL